MVCQLTISVDGLFDIMENITAGTGGIIQLAATLVLLPLWIGLSFFIPYVLGKGINGLFLSGRSFKNSSLFFAFIGGIGFFALFVLVLGPSIIQIFSVTISEELYEYLLPIGSTGNTVGIVSSLAVGLLRGTDEER
ncbi:MAG: hypothetical protein KAR43_07710 [Deltaproteobacteria bacterium]|nr:hypothetical protein [Deltaproteobacteria bacterium]